MTAAPPLSFPSSRVLASWWRQLAPRQPQGLWVGHLLLHRLEALVRISHPSSLDPFHRLILQALATTTDTTLAGLDARLRLGVQVVGRVMRDLQALGLIEAEAGAGWSPTPLAQQALAEGQFSRPGHERRVFHFLVRSGDQGNNSTPTVTTGETLTPHFLRVRAGVSRPWPAPEGWVFNPDLLATCAAQPREWKEQHGFPTEVEQLVALSGPEQTEASGFPDWQRVMLDQAEHLFAVLLRIENPEIGEQLLGLAVQQDGWVLEASEPAFVLGERWAEVFPELTHDPPLEAWPQAWRQWCQPRSIPPAEVEACTLEWQPPRLRVLAPRRLVERLRAARSDALKGEAWVLTGMKNIRWAALLDVVEKA